TMKKDSKVFLAITSSENIYSAIYAYKSYSNYLDKKNAIIQEDIDPLNFNLTSKLITKIRNKIKKILVSGNYFFCSIRLKPKKKDPKGNIIFRPIHYMLNQYDLIAMVSILNFFMYSFIDNKRYLSEISNSIPSNFYGSLPNDDYDSLYMSW